MGLGLRIVVPWNRIARTTVGSAFVGTGQYNGLFAASFFFPSRRGDVGLGGSDASAFGRFDRPRLMLSLFLRVAWRWTKPSLTWAWVERGLPSESVVGLLGSVMFVILLLLMQAEGQLSAEASPMIPGV